jgi:hypothetical protein
VPTVVFEELIIIVTYLLACNLVVQHVVSCNWVLPVGNIFIIIIIIIIIIKQHKAIDLSAGAIQWYNRDKCNLKRNETAT